ncbi:MAG: hypothetical protein HY843_03350 [Bdellovibrio sp.]|nr:hypothetical protein [Bdellovibrio sp.]
MLKETKLEKKIGNFVLATAVLVVLSFNVGACGFKIKNIAQPSINVLTENVQNKVSQ